MREVPFAAMELARYVVDKCAREGEPVSNLLLQKMMYFLQFVYCSVTSGRLLFEDEFEAWPYGPVLPEVYHEYSYYGANPIEERYEEFLLPDLGELREFVDDGVVDLRGKYPWDLVRISHAVGSPWWIVRESGGSTIDNSLIVIAATKESGGVDGSA